MATLTIDRRTEDDELVRVLEWRLVQLVRGGYDPADAGVLASHPEVDLHEALRLVERSCPPKTALRILL